MHKKSCVFLFIYFSSNEIRIRRTEVSSQKIRGSLSALAFFWTIVAFLGLGILGASSSDITSARSAQNAVNVGILEIQANLTKNAGGPIKEGDVYVNDEIKMEEYISDLSTENIPNLWPREDKITNEFGFRRNPFGGRTYEFHEGMDISGERGDDVLAAGAGTVIKAGWQGGYGNMIEIDHGNGITTRYGHLSKVLVQVGENVSKGQRIGLVGSTGRSTGPHLHYELRINGKAVDPRRLLPPEKAEIER
ncbi:MAG: M23 family metallopeptidase [Pyrinomonadaceae bacterium]|nr:M23 family metallopeptidase [Pyrinomonadaceae bacterium]MCX7639049.1 M23 family metallopeptidase [Pyrinomonadaceae bacterium]MDW8303730.1 M23 family metallopeptidase [Acidobacteriota bacterium]